MSSVTGIIGGSGFYSVEGSTGPEVTNIATPYSDKPVPVYRSLVAGKPVAFLPRHGIEHGVPPHRVNYRANVWALRESGVNAIIAINVVGGIRTGLEPGALVVPDQLIDYTWGRAHTYFDVLEDAGNHVDFTWPYDQGLRQALLDSAHELDIACIDGGVYGCTQGPRLETAAEIQKLRQDGCDIVGMTSMPEAALARELTIPYASIALVVNLAAGLAQDAISFADIAASLDDGIEVIRRLLPGSIAKLP